MLFYTVRGAVTKAVPDRDAEERKEGYDLAKIVKAGVVLTLCGTLRADVTPQGCLDPECKPSKKLASVKLRKKAVVGGESSKEQCLEMVQRNQQGLDRVAMSARADAPRNT